MKTDFTIFYSWQSDVGKYANKSYIENKIKKAISAIHDNNANYNIDIKKAPAMILDLLRLLKK